MKRDDFIAAHRIETEFEVRGIKLIGGGNQRMAICPLHDDGTPSLSVTIDKQVWHCHGCKAGGSVIDFLMAYEKKTFAEVVNNGNSKPTPWKPLAKKDCAPPEKPVLEKTYTYYDERGNEVYRVLRYRPKTFRQQQLKDGLWIWGMEGVERRLYRLPEIIKSQIVAFAEGEKDADTLTELGYCGTCNVGGAGKWLDAYTESLAGKDVLIFGDNDEPGQAHANLVFESIAGKAKTVRIVPIPKTSKDVTDYIGTFESVEKAKETIESLVMDAHPFVQGTRLPVYSMAEIEPMYRRHVRLAESDALDLGRWIPTLGRRVRPLVPGELVFIIGDTGTGKTGLLQNIAHYAKPLKTLFFELELPGELIFERSIALSAKMDCQLVHTTYASGDGLGTPALEKIFPHIFICWESKLTIDDIERIITRSELKIGERPKLVLVDYIQLVSGEGKRYERVSNVAEGLKVLAKSTRTIVIVTSQISRPEGDDPEIFLHDAKDSGSIENSSGLVLGVWRDAKDATILHLKILKNTKGQAGGKPIPCNFNGKTMQITELATNSPADEAGEQPPDRRYPD